jgi:predicted ATPase/class 3 adenylate cyclase
MRYWEASMRFAVWGEVGAQGADGLVVLSGRLRLLLAGLLVSRNAEVSRNDLIGIVWGDESEPANAEASLRQYVSRLRKALAEAEDGADRLVVTTPSGYRLDVDRSRVDADLLADAVAAGVRPAELEGLISGEPYGSYCDEWWCLAEVERQRQLATEARNLPSLSTRALPAGTVTFLFTDMERSSEQWEKHREDMAEAVERGNEIITSAIEQHGGHLFSATGGGFAAAFHRAIDAVQAAVEAQQTLQTRQRELPTVNEVAPEDCVVHVRMGIHTGEATERGGIYLGSGVDRAARIMSAAHGDQVVASSVTAALLDDSVKVQPLGAHRLSDESATVELVQVLVDQGKQHFPPLRTLNLPSHNLPVLHSEMIGRTQELETVSAALQRRRLLTLTGSGGVGKTTLAVAAASGVARSFADGVFFVEFAPVLSGDLVAQAVADAAGLQLQSSRAGRTPLQAQVAGVLGDRDVLIVLDNCEHLIDHVAEFVDELLDAGRRARVLCTSREPLALPDEFTFRVPSLAIDELAPLESPAVSVVFARAQAQGVERQKLEAHLDSIVELCRSLDGIPLALELAAAQLPHMTPPELLQLLERSLDALAVQRRGRRRHRHETLRAVVDWSWKLLDPAEQQLLSRLAVFIGGCTRETANHVCHDPGDPPIEPILQRLCSKSLLIPVDERGTTRFTMLETVRAFAFEQLDASGGMRGRRERHLAWCLESLDPGFETQYYSFEHWAEYEKELPNLRAAIEWSLNTGNPTAAARLACGGSGRWRSGLGGEEGERWVRALLETDLPDDIRARTLWAGVDSALDSADRALFVDRVEEASELAASTGSSALLATIQASMAPASSRRDPEESLGLLREAASLAAGADAQHAHALAVAFQAFPLIAEDRFDEALDIANRAVELAVPHSYDRLSAYWMGFHVHLVLGNCEDARAWLNEATTVETDSGLHVNRGWRFYETVLEAWCGNPERAREHLETLIRQLDHAGTPMGRADAALAAGIIALEEGNHQLAAEAASAVAGQFLHHQGNADILHRFMARLDLRTTAPTSHGSHAARPVTLEQIPYQLLESTREA